MAQQVAIIVLVDIANALQLRTLDGNVYWFDNMKFQGSVGEGTGDLVTAIPGSYWNDGSQATEQVLNWLPASLGSIPPTVPCSYRIDRSEDTDQQALPDLAALAGRPAGIDTAATLAGLQGRGGLRRNSRNLTGSELIDVTDHAISSHATHACNCPTPVITNITGAAVDEKVIYAAQYGSPDMVSGGWYWSATVDTSRPGTYTYTMSIQLHDLVHCSGGPVWEPVSLTCGAAIMITAEPKRNGFTGTGLGLLPVCLGAST
jgi:hypothetical protein